MAQRKKRLIQFGFLMSLVFVVCNRRRDGGTGKSAAWRSFDGTLSLSESPVSP